MATTKKNRVGYMHVGSDIGNWERIIHGARAVPLRGTVTKKSFDALCSECKARVVKALEQRATDHPEYSDYRITYLRVKTYFDTGIWDLWLGRRYEDVGSGFERVMSELEMFARANVEYCQDALDRLRAIKEGSNRQ